jgi:two-component system, OmpR family, copper resistance phosphate regulon response regulator CusR
MSHSQTASDVSVPQRILMVDDERRIVRFVARRLAEAGYEVFVAFGGTEALDAAHTRPYDLVILDLLMQDVDGVTVLRQLMLERPHQPVIVLSCLTDTASKVRCLDLGASDFVPKPFFFDELLARVQAHLRIAARARGTQVNAAGIRLDLDRQTADAGAGPVFLTKKEFLLLRELARHPGATVSRESLLSSVWGLDFDPGSNVVEVFVGRLRAKLSSQVVETVRKEGYRLAVE